MNCGDGHTTNTPSKHWKAHLIVWDVNYISKRLFQQQQKSSLVVRQATQTTLLIISRMQALNVRNIYLLSCAEVRTTKQRKQWREMRLESRNKDRAAHGRSCEGFWSLFSDTQRSVSLGIAFVSAGMYTCVFMGMCVCLYVCECLCICV